MLYTSYYSNIVKLPASMIKVAISRKVPPRSVDYIFMQLAPTYTLINSHKETQDDEAFTREYLASLFERYTFDDIHKSLLSLLTLPDLETKDICFLCFEKPNKFCHRHIVAEIFRTNGYEVKEYENKYY